MKFGKIWPGRGVKISNLSKTRQVGTRLEGLGAQSISIPESLRQLDSKSSYEIRHKFGPGGGVKISNLSKTRQVGTRLEGLGAQNINIPESLRQLEGRLTGRQEIRTERKLKKL